MSSQYFYTPCPAPCPVCHLSVTLSSCVLPFVFSCFSPSVTLPGLTFTVYSTTPGCSEPMGMKSRLVTDRQITASSTFRTWGIEAFTWLPHYARLDKQGKTNAWTAATNNQSEWLQVDRPGQGRTVCVWGGLFLHCGKNTCLCVFRWTLHLLRRYQGSSHREPKTSAPSSSSQPSKWLTVTMGGPGPS